MDDDWDAEDFTPLPPVLAKEATQVKSQWDDEDAEEEPVEEKPKVVAVPKPKAEKKKEKPKKATSDEGVLSDPLAEKLRQQRLVEEADYQNTSELFGGKTRGGRSLEDFIPKSEDDFLEYAELLAQKIRPFEKSFHYMTLLRAIMRHSVANMKASDAKEIASSMTVIANEKLKAERDATAGKKKTGAKKKQLIVDKPDDDGMGGVSYDAVDDYDFM
ncbi:uncharacterized protein [Physcomitrium patens]|uniref:Eukaryotic translation initiation factor 3 subunit J n=1 Tax=Physcomitrium patens TaxID=3218 RepID=A9TBZ8_PHYPA|nr:eukaryotic translation initiation factor 3 subunit J-like [Physcomitrium patens]PNR55607.1 hypothetical protein PHYPA_006504 [Physcomitrium patens]|eukprot:XP_024374457.1 eukaryotic translation initiation factor 3 subunit J-like [Physcomitrella patens]